MRPNLNPFGESRKPCASGDAECGGAAVSCRGAGGAERGRRGSAPKVRRKIRNPALAERGFYNVCQLSDCYFAGAVEAESLADLLPLLFDDLWVFLL